MPIRQVRGRLPGRPRRLPRRRARAALAAVGAVAAVGSWGLVEAGRPVHVHRRIPVRRLPAALDGLRLAHLSDLHVGAPGRSASALARAIDALAAGPPVDLVAITGDLLARARGQAALARQLRRLAPAVGAFAVLGNHDYGAARDPFADATEPDLAGTGVHLLGDERVTLEVRGARVAIAGVDPRTYARSRRGGTGLGDPAADLRILLCHFPGVLDRLAPGEHDVVLAGHLHGGQICVPAPGRRRRLAAPGARYPEGVFGRDGTTLHVSRGTGTTFVPLRVGARPEVTVLTLVAVGRDGTRAGPAGAWPYTGSVGDDRPGWRGPGGPGEAGSGPWTGHGGRA